MKELEEFLSQLGLSVQEVQTYLFLFQNGASTILELSKGVHVNRTALYRLCEKLNGEGYLKKFAQFNTTRYEAASIDFLKTKVENVEKTLSGLKGKYTDIVEVVKKMRTIAVERFKVVHYSGKEEVKQLLWNYLETKTDVYSFGYKTMSKALGKEFIVHWWNEAFRRFTQRGIQERLLANPGTFEMKNTVDQQTREKYIGDPSTYTEQRVIDEKIFEIYYETFIYNDVFGIVEWDKNNVFGVEIYNQGVADQERAIYKILWGMGKPFKEYFSRKKNKLGFVS